MRPFYNDGEEKDKDIGDSLDGKKAPVQISGDNLPTPKKRVTLLQSLQAFFKFGTRTKPNSKDKEVFPVETRTGIDSSIKDIGSRFTPEVQRLWDSYCTETADSSMTLKEREDRYKDMDYMEYNDPLIAHSIDLYSDESAQVDDQFNLINVDSEDPRVSVEINDLFKKLGINQEYVREVAHDLVKYGDSFDVVDCAENSGVSVLTPVSVFDITDRLEFKASEEKKKNLNKNTFNTIATRNKSVSSYLTDIQSKGNNSPSASFTSYLLGFVISEDTYLYPWQVVHYRLQSRRSEFWPFGRPLFINLIGPYRQLKTSQNLMALGRMMKFPKSIYSVATGQDMTTGEKWEAVNEAREEFANTAYTSKSKDGLAMGDEYWVPKDTISFEQYTNDINLDDIADVEYLRNNIIMGTGIPRGYLVVDGQDSQFSGSSGESLIQQSKPFARAVFRIQSVILEGLSNLVRTHFLLTGKFSGEFTPFSLTLNYPVQEEESDMLDLKSKTLDLATSVINNIKDILGYEGVVPPELVKDVFSRFSFLTPDEVEELVNSFVNSQEKDASLGVPEENDREPEEPEEDRNEPSPEPEESPENPSEEEAPEEPPEEKPEPPAQNGKISLRYAKFREFYNKRITEETIRTSVFDAYKKLNIIDVRTGRKHLYVSNENSIGAQEKEVYRFLRMGSVKKIYESKENES